METFEPRSAVKPELELADWWTSQLVTAVEVNVPNAATKVTASKPFISIAVEGVIVEVPAATAFECRVSFVFLVRFISSAPYAKTPDKTLKCFGRKTATSARRYATTSRLSWLAALWVTPA